MPRYGQLNESYVASWFARDEPGGPMWALNLMKYRERAEYADGRESSNKHVMMVVALTYQEPGIHISRKDCRQRRTHRVEGTDNCSNNTCLSKTSA